MIGLGGSSTLGIGLVVQLRDQFSNRAKTISNSINQLTGSANMALKNSYGAMVGIGAGLAGVGYGITRGMISATKEAVSFQDVMINIKALSGSINPNTGEIVTISTAQMNKLGEVAMALGPKFGMSAIEIGHGMEELVKAGVQLKDIPTILEQMVVTAMGAGEKLGGEQGVAARMTDLMMAFKITPDQVGRMGDILAKTAIESTVSFNSMAESFKYAQDIFKGFGFTLEESSALIGVMGNVGIKGSIAGISLGNTFRELGKAASGTSDKKNKALGLLGLTPKDLMDEYGSLKGPLELLTLLKNRTRGMGAVEKQQVLMDLTNVRAMRSIGPLLEMLTKGPSDRWSGKSFTDMLNTLQNESLGSNMGVFEEKSKSAAFQAERLKQNWENFKITLGNSLIPLLNRLVPVLNKMVEGLIAFTKSPLGQFLGQGIAMFGALLIPIGLVTGAIGLMGRALMFVSGGFAPFKSAALYMWNALIARALTYATVIRGVGIGQSINAAGSLINSKTGRIITPAYKMAGASVISTAAAGAGGTIASGAAAGSMTALSGAISGVVVALGSFALALGAGLLLYNLISSLWEFSKGLKDDPNDQSAFARQRRAQGTFINWDEVNGKSRFKPAYEGQTEEDVNNYNKFYGNKKEESIADKYQWAKPRETTLNVFIDGKKSVTQKVYDDTEDDAVHNLGINQ